MRFSMFSVADHYPAREQTLGGLYDQALHEIELAERLGFSGFFTAEHHFHEYGVVTSPPALLAAASQRTSRIGLGVAISPLSMRNPLLAAEEYAMLDQISGGRLLLGVGSGYLKHEFDGFAIGPWEKRARFDEGLEVMLKGWEGEPFSYHGYYNHVSDTGLAVTPLQKPHPPLWVAITRPEAALHIGRQGRQIMMIPYAKCGTKEDLRTMVDQHSEGLAESDQDGHKEVAVAIHAYVSDSSEKAKEEAGAAFDLYDESRRNPRRRSWDEVSSAELALFGSPEQISEQITRLEDMGVDHLLLMMNFGALEPERVRRSMERFSQEVMPNFATEKQGMFTR